MKNKFKDNNIIIPFRIEDYTGTEVNFSKVLYPQAFYFNGFRANTSSNEYIYKKQNYSKYMNVQKKILRENI